jgi:tetratricopeptide (TPR) repeat protein
MLSDRGLISEKGRVLSIDAVSGIPMPDTLQSVIGARIDTLARDQKALMHDAAVSGKVFWSGALSAIGGVDRATANHALQELVRKELVRPARESSIAGEQEYVFWHALVRDVCYGQIPRAARADKHCAMAGWLERVAGGRVLDHAEVLAHHYTQALELARAARRRKQVAELEEPAKRFLVMAGDRALNLDAAKAEGFFRRALDLLPDDHAERALVLLKAGEATESLGRLEESAAYMENAAAEFRAQGNVLGQGQSLVQLQFVAWSLGDTARARRTLLQAIDLLEPEPPGRELCFAYAMYAGQRWIAGDPAEALKFANKALKLASELGDQENLIRALGIRGAAQCDLGDPDGMADLEEALSKSLDLGHSELTAFTYANLAVIKSLLEGPRRTLALYKEAFEFASQRGLARWAANMQSNIAFAYYALGDWDESLERLEEVIRWGREHRSALSEVSGLNLKACILLCRGHLKEAASFSNRILTLARDIGDPQALVPALATVAAIRAALSDTSAGISLIRELESITIDNMEWRARELPDATRALVSMGQFALATSLVPNESDIHTILARYCILGARAILKEIRGDWAEAAHLYKKASGLWNEYGQLAEVGHNLLGAGRCSLALGDHEAAANALAGARTIFSRLGAVPLLTETDRHLRTTKSALNK